MYHCLLSSSNLTYIALSDSNVSGWEAIRNRVLLLFIREREDLINRLFPQLLNPLLLCCPLLILLFFLRELIQGGFYLEPPLCIFIFLLLLGVSFDREGGAEWVGRRRRRLGRRRKGRRRR